MNRGLRCFIAFLLFLLACSVLGFFSVPIVKATGLFAYDGTYIYYWGGSNGSEITSLDIWEADNSNGWGEVEKDTTNTSFTFHCGLWQGEDDWGDQYETWFADEGVSWIFASDSSQNALTLSSHSDNHFRLGRLVDADLKIGDRGVTVIGNRKVYFALNQYTDVALYSSTFMSKVNYASRLIPKTTSFKMYGCTLDGFIYWQTSTCEPDVYRTNIQKSQYGLLSYVSTGSQDDLLLHSCDYGMRLTTSYGGTLENTVFKNNTKMFYCYRPSVDTPLINCESDVWSFYWASGTYSGKVLRQYTFDARITFQNGTYVNGTSTGARIVLQHYGEDAGVDYNTTLGDDGSIPSLTLTYEHYNSTGGDVGYAYGPYNLKVYNVTDYDDINYNITVDEATDLTLALTPTSHVIDYVDVPVPTTALRVYTEADDFDAYLTALPSVDLGIGDLITNNLPITYTVTIWDKTPKRLNVTFNVWVTEGAYNDTIVKRMNYTAWVDANANTTITNTITLPIANSIFGALGGLRTPYFIHVRLSYVASVERQYAEVLYAPVSVGYGKVILVVGLFVGCVVFFCGLLIYYRRKKRSHGTL